MTTTSENKVEAPKNASVEVSEDTTGSYKCLECGFEAKTLAGLTSHQRSHE